MLCLNYSGYMSALYFTYLRMCVYTMYILHLSIIFFIISRLIRNQEIYKLPLGKNERVKSLTHFNSKAVYVLVVHTQFNGLA